MARLDDEDEDEDFDAERERKKAIKTAIDHSYQNKRRSNAEQAEAVVKRQESEDETDEDEEEETTKKTHHKRGGSFSVSSIDYTVEASSTDFEQARKSVMHAVRYFRKRPHGRRREVH